MIWVGGVALAVWLVLVFARDGFWLTRERDTRGLPPPPAAWPSVVAVVPARDEAEVIARSIGSLVAQDYAGDFRIILVDDNSSDGTAEIARGTATESDRLTILTGAPLAPGWTGKLWAVHQGLAEAARFAPNAAYVLLTDADIVHEPAGLRRLVAKAETERRRLVSLMVKLRCEAGWEKLLIPAFVFFFQKLYPFSWVNDPNRPTAAAAGGCMLVRRDTLSDIGGVERIRNRLIDDCALAREIKARGPIWLGLAERTLSLRPYDRLGEVWRMVARSAFEQLNRSVLALAGTLVGMVVLYVVPPVAAVYGVAAGDGFAALFGVGAWGLMAAAYAPTVRLYGLAPAYTLTLPLAGVLYALMTLDSARRHWAGKGGGWKGRSYS